MDVSKWDIITEENETVKAVTYHEIIYIYNMSTNSITFQRPGTILPAFGFAGWYPNNPGTIWKPKLAQEGRVCVGCGLPEVAKCCRYCCWFMTFHGLLIIVFRFGCRILESLDWFKGKSTGNHGFYHQM